jgi:formiminotetrahydrofolate cyclodeaminase
VMRLALEAMRLARIVADRGNANAATDAAVAVHMAMAALEGAGLNVRVNAHSLTDGDISAHLRDTVSRLIYDAQAIKIEVLSVVETRAGLS